MCASSYITYIHEKAYKKNCGGWSMYDFTRTDKYHYNTMKFQPFIKTVKATSSTRASNFNPALTIIFTVTNCQM